MSRNKGRSIVRSKAVRFLVLTLVVFTSFVLMVPKPDSSVVSAQDDAPEATTVTFNGSGITINDNGNGAPYPSALTVSGVTSFTRLQVRLNNFTHTFAADVDIILVGPQGQRSILMSDAGSSLTPVTNQTFTFVQTELSPIPAVATLATGSYRPANYPGSGASLIDTFPAPGPGALTDAPADLFVFNGTNPNGTWNLYVVDDAGGDVGSIASWSLTFTVPQTFTVNSAADPGTGVCDVTECTLREAITAAQDGDLINFSTLFNTPRTIDLLDVLSISRSITLQGPGANLLTVRAAGPPRVFEIAQAVTNGVAISGMTITGGNLSSTGFLGGGISSQSYLALTNVHLTDNQSNSGGGGVSLSNADGVFTNCTFSNNRSQSQGGAIYFTSNFGRTLRVVNSTISGNSSGISNVSFNGNNRLEIINSTIFNNLSNGGVFTSALNAGSSATTTLRNSIITGNSPYNLAIDLPSVGTETVISNGFNLSNNYNGFTTVGTDVTNATPRLAPLALYGGQTPTHALLHASPAINAGDASGQARDQRGQVRPFAGSGSTPIPDIGAFESQTFPGIVVNNTNDGSAGSLRAAMATLSGVTGDTFYDILFDTSVFNTQRTVNLSSGQLVVNGNMNIIAPGADLLTISGTNNFRVFAVSTGITATLSGMTITGGNGGGPTLSGSGGGILNQSSLTIANSAVTNNTASSFGGGVLNNGSSSILNLTNSTVSGNTANGGGTGGGIETTGFLTVLNSTISGNNATGGASAGGIINRERNTKIINSTITNNSGGPGFAGGVLESTGSTGSVTVRNSIIAGNVNNSSLPDTGGASITSEGFNLIGNRGAVTFPATGDQSGTGASPLNPLLGTLQNNNGTMPTHALLAGSPALDKGNSSGSTADQRGLTRPIDLAGITNTSDSSDIGAFEAQTAPVVDNPPTAFGSSSNVTTSGSTSQSVNVAYSDDVAINVSTINNGDIMVTGPGGFTATPNFVVVDIPTNGTPRIAVYSFVPPGGSWDAADNGTYSINMVANQVADTGGNFVAAGPVGTFTVNIGCTFGLSPSSPQSVPATSSNLSVGVTTGAGCAWTATTSTPWITITSGSSGNGNGTVNMTFAANTGSARSGSLTIAGQTYTINQAAGAAVTIRAPFDYDGDNKTDISIFRPGPGEWWVLRSSNGSNFALQFGSTTDKIVPADYTGDGKADVAFWRPLDGNWFILRSEDSTFFAFPFGASGDVPVPGDFDGDNKADAAVFRPSTLNWFILKSTGGTDILTFGAAGDKPVVADYDGDAKADIAIYRPIGGSGSEWWVRRSSNGSTFALQFGLPTDRPVPGDFTGDGKADVAFWRPSNGNWFVLRSEDSSFFAFPFGTSGDVPLQGDYDGDGKTDAGVFRPSSLNWFVLRSTAGTLIQTFGIAGDIPTPSAYVP